MEEARQFQNLAASKKKDPTERAADEAAGQKLQTAIRDMLAKLPTEPVRDRAEFLPLFDAEHKKAGLNLKKPLKETLLAALSERDESAAICRDEDGNPEPDPDLRDTENVPLDDVEKARVSVPAPADPVGKAVQDFFDREVRPHVPDAWVNADVRDDKDGGIGVVGYEINFNRYFYRYTPPRPLEAIEADIKAVEHDVLKLLKEVAG